MGDDVPVADEVPLLEARGLVKTFPIRSGALGRAKGRVHAVTDVDLDVWTGEVIGLVGESGCGKSTLGRLLLRLLEPDSGTLRYEGQDLLAASGPELRRLRAQMQIVFQDPFASLDPRATIGDSIAEGLRVQGVPARERQGRVDAALELVGLEPYHARRYPHQFSGGQRQRIGIARALAVDPKLLVADEPVSALDVSIQSQILNLLRDLQRRLHLTILFVAHNLAVVEHLCDRVAVMYLGRIVELGGRDDVFGRPLHPYTRALLSAAPVPDPEVAANRARIVLAGDLPSPAAPPPGCAFHTRCPFVRPTRCHDEMPALRTLDGGPERHQVACHWAEEIVADAATRAAGTAPNAV